MLWKFLLSKSQGIEWSQTFTLIGLVFDSVHEAGHSLKTFPPCYSHKTQK